MFAFLVGFMLISSVSCLQHCYIGTKPMEHRSMYQYSISDYIACDRGTIKCFRQLDQDDYSALPIPCPAMTKISSLLQKHQALNHPRKLSISVPEDDRLWPKGVVCLTGFEHIFTLAQKKIFYKAILQVEQHTHVRFLDLNDCRKNSHNHQYCNGCQNYIQMHHAGKGSRSHNLCHSVVGFNLNGTNGMTMGDGCFEVKDPEKEEDFGTSLHEIGHALGLSHEHQHPQRTFGVFWKELPSYRWGVYAKKFGQRLRSYDPDSIMHYALHDAEFCMPKFCPKDAPIATVPAEQTPTVNEDKSDCVKVGTKFCDLNESTEAKDCVNIERHQCDEAATKRIGQAKKLSPKDVESLMALYPGPPAWAYENSTILNSELMAN